VVCVVVVVVVCCAKAAPAVVKARTIPPTKLSNDLLIDYFLLQFKASSAFGS
jgi:hypothetical protein